MRALLTACWGHLAPRPEFHFLSGRFLLAWRGLALVRQARVGGAERIHLWLIHPTVGSPRCGGQETDGPGSPRPVRGSRQACKCQAETQSPRRRLSGFCFAFPRPGTAGRPFLNGLCDVRTGSAAGLTRPSLPSGLCVCVTPSRPRRPALGGSGRHLLVTPGPRPLHFAPRVPESDQLLRTATEIHLRGPHTGSRLLLGFECHLSSIPTWPHFYLPFKCVARPWPTALLATVWLSK